MLFDLVASTYASFPYTPYLDTFRPEVGMQLITRASNIVKYWREIGPLRVALQYSPDEQNTSWYASAGFLQSKRKRPFPAEADGGDLDRALIGLYWQGAANGGFLMGDARQRRMWTLGTGYQTSTQWNLGAHWYRTRQSRSGSAAFNGHADFAVVVANYSLSKRTSLYAGLDHARTGGGAALALDSHGAQQRSGLTPGLRHWF